MISFGKNIQKRRINLGLDTSDLAKLVNYPNRSYIEKIEADKMYPSTKKIPEMAKALSCNIEDLFKNVEIEDSENDFIFIRNTLKFINSFEENTSPKRALAFSLDVCKKHYFSLFDKFIREDFVSKINKLIIENYYEDNVELEKIEYFFSEKEYEICLVGLCELLEKMLNSKKDRKNKNIDKTEDDSLIILDDFLRI
ncbi:helix-turn-helix domain-containing protein [Fusobacterium polymorphum]|uniref:helix-turn-helix domain-containing protein n=1 Tax=Fusobacterium nucleatum subsp. polymorphum TaxID=76857 RepID=UPI001DA84656|nr:helix-turn-helix transcriptional regulator [Fusobacterium nucleatum]MBS5187402.1 helix-turn-helix transcriptional regulator [Fusobacterium nucleatum]MCG6841581.1 helix-turn-helix domain-containing protein [Fusobacterium nucleatum]